MSVNANIKAVKIPALAVVGDLLVDVSAMPAISQVLGSSVDIAEIDTCAVAATATGDAFWDDPAAARLRPYNVKDGVLSIDVCGTLLGNFSAQLGPYATGYQYIAKALERGVNDPSVSSIVLNFDTPGGTVRGVTDAVNAINSAKQVKPVIAYCESANSAGYWLASCATEVIASRMAEVGSIGVITTHVDISEAARAGGVKYTPIYVGQRKADGSPYAPISDEAKASIMKRLTSVYDIFVGDVAKGRGLDEAKIRETEAEVFGAAEALEKGLIDKIEDRSAFETRIQSTRKDEQMNAAAETAAPAAKTYEDGVAEGMAQALARVQEIQGMDEAKGREDLAQALALQPSISIDTARALLAAAPAASTPVAPVAAAPVAPAAAPASEAPAGADALAETFAGMMAAGSPKVSPDVEKVEGFDATDPKIAALIAAH